MSVLCVHCVCVGCQLCDEGERPRSRDGNLEGTCKLYQIDEVYPVEVLFLYHVVSSKARIVSHMTWHDAHMTWAHMTSHDLPTGGEWPAWSRLLGEVASPPLWAAKGAGGCKAWEGKEGPEASKSLSLLFLSLPLLCPTSYPSSFTLCPAGELFGCKYWLW